LPRDELIWPDKLWLVSWSPLTRRGCSKVHLTVDTIPVTEVGPRGPIVQGSIRIAGDAVLEVEQCLQIDAAIMNR